MSYYVYIMASGKNGTLYTGVTRDIQRRVHEHKNGITGGFTAKYGVKTLVHVEETDDVHAAIAREKQIKSWSRARKIMLIETGNSDWTDLAEEWMKNP